jgi:DNA-binding transcriptional LysR family regulator
MADWEDIRHFVTLAREGTLSAAARTLGVDHATVARRVAALEASTGLKLVDRRARITSLTEEGKRIAAVAAPMEEAAFAVGRTAQAAKPGVEGEVAISAFGFSLYGAPAYLNKTPPHAFAFIGYDASMAESPQEVWLRTIVGDREVVLRTNDLGTQIAAARSGLGIAALPHYLGDGDPQLQRQAVTQKPISRDVWLLVHRDLRQVPTVRAVMEFLTECVKAK